MPFQDAHLAHWDITLTKVALLPAEVVHPENSARRPDNWTVQPVRLENLLPTMRVNVTIVRKDGLARQEITPQTMSPLACPARRDDIPSTLVRPPATLVKRVG